MVLVDAIYIHQSGGKVLLELLIDTIVQRELEKSFYFVLDKRLETSRITQLNSKQYKFLEASEAKRKSYYKRLPRDVQSILCFANVPPPIALPVDDIYIFFQNALLLKSKGMNYDFITNLKFFFKRVYIKFQNKANYNWIVQTPVMRKQLIEQLGINAQRVQAIPFFQDDWIVRVNHQLTVNTKRFLYVADGVDQKNHSSLLKAWEIICNTTDLRLELNLTIPDKFTRLVHHINQLNKNGCLIINHGFCNKRILTDLYSSCNYFIFPSLTESFGLPLIEAASAGCEIISSDLPYVYDVVKPLRTFDPNNVASIVDAVKKVFENPSERGTEIRVENQINKFIDLIRN